MQVMETTRGSFTDEIRRAVETCGRSRYRICKELGIAESQMSRFMNGKGWLGEGTLNALAELLDYHVAAAKPRQAKREKGDQRG
jgi:transcriptional regulator with XRE-family HTH domain